MKIKKLQTVSLSSEIGNDSFSKDSLPDKNFRQPRVLVVGNLNFLGSFLAELLLRKNCRVTAVDYYREVLPERCLKNCLAFENFYFFKKNLSDPLTDLGSFDYYFDLLGLEAVDHSSREKIRLLQTSALTTAKLLDLACHKRAKYLLAIPFEEEAKLSVTEDLALKYLSKKNLNLRIIRLKNLYGPRMNLSAPDQISRMIKSVLEKKPIRVIGRGENKLYPTFVADAVYGLSKAMFTAGTKGKTYSLLSNQGVNQLLVAKKLKKISSESLPIKYVAGHNLKKINEKKLKKSQKDLNWQPRVNLDEGLKLTLTFFRKPKKKVLKKEKIFLKNKSAKFRFRFFRPSFAKLLFLKKGIIFLAVLFSLFFLPLVYFFGQAGWGIFNLRQAFVSGQAGKITSVLNQSYLAQKNLSAAQKKADQMVFLLNLVGQKRYGLRLKKYFSVAENLSQGIYHTSLAAAAANDLGHFVINNASGQPRLLLTQIKRELAFAHQQLSLAWVEAETEPKMAKALGFLEKKFSFFPQAKKGLDILPELIGLEGKRTYLILLQNNMELRPTGGFIGSYGLLTFANGRLLDLSIEDVYQADGQLKGHVEPPLPLKEHLGEAGWYLRDSNWHPDWPISARRAAWFLKKEIGQEVDGVIGVNLFLAQKILKALGEVKLLDYQETINANNLFSKAEAYVQTDFFPGSTQKKDFLGNLTRALFDEVRNANPSVWLSLGKSLYESLAEKEVLLYLQNSAVMKTVTALGWDGSLKAIECQTGLDNCYPDYLMLVEANLGVNKANYFVSRDIFHQAVVDEEGTITETLRLTYKNTSSSETFPAGRYKNYLRLLTPLKTELVQVLVAGQNLPLEEVDKEIVGEKQSFGFLVEVPIREKLDLEIRYSRFEKIDLSQTITYLLLLQKQSGIKDDLFFFQFQPPPFFQLIKSLPSPSSLKKPFSFSEPFDQDLVFELQMTR